MSAEFSRTMFICGNNNRYTVDYITKSGHHTHALIDAINEKEACEFIEKLRDTKRVERIYQQ